jgi:hypothetical protein
MPSASAGGGLRHTIVLWGAALLASVVMTWPLASDPGRLGRTQNSGDARFAVWNVGWVAHVLTTNPGGLFDANIFYPHRDALAFSEANIGAGTLAVPGWLATRNALFAHNVVVLFAFSASIVFTWLLARRLTGDPGAAATAAVIYAFCPYVFTHTAHIQLLMTGGIPLCLLAFHRLADAPSPRRGVELGLALAVQALCCAYYGISAGLTIGYATLFLAASRGLWRSRAYWIAIALGAGVSLLLVAPFFVPYLRVQEAGFARSLDDAQQWAAYWRSYLASGAHAHEWLLPLIKDWNQAALFPGFAAVGLGLAGAWSAGRRGAQSRDREAVFLYGSIAVLTLWATLGPRAGLYTLFYETIPVFSMLRAPERMGIVVTLCLALLAAFGVRALRNAFPARRRAVAVAVCALALFELNDLPFDWRPADPIPAGYRMLARLPRGPVVEFPFFDRRIDFHLHTRYMLNSTVHWQPLVNGYSDHFPGDFRAVAPTLASFPSRESFEAMRDRRVRYITINRGRQGYGAATAPEVMRRLEPYLQNLRLVSDDGTLVIYEIVSWPR